MTGSFSGSQRVPVSPALDRHVRSRQIALARSIQSRKKIYLDTCFWIALRKVVLDDQPTPAERKLLHLLRRGVAEGRFVCPISESIFVEVTNQYDPRTRMATVGLIDELSLGVSLISGRERIATEIAHFVHRMWGETELYPVKELVWTKLANSMGPMHPTVEGFDETPELRMQRSVFDKIWDASLTQVAEAITGAEGAGKADLAAAAASINVANAAHSDGLKSFQQTYRDEIVGMADNCYGVILDLIAIKAEKAGAPTAAPDSPEAAEYARVARNLLVHAFTKPETKTALRSMHIQACMHAGLRWNKGTKFVANHLFDFEHATAALAYCDAFFTEGFLANLVNARHIDLGTLNGCQTTNRADDAVAMLRTL